MANLVFLKYNFLFDPSESWAHLSQFEADLADFFAANGMEAEVVKSVSGQIGERVLLLKRFPVVSRTQTQDKPDTSATDRLNQIKSQTPPKNFKEYQERGVPRNIVNQERRAPNLNFNIPGRTLRKKVRMP